MLLGILGASFWEIRKRNCKSWLWKQNGFWIPPHPLANFEIQKYYQNEPRMVFILEIIFLKKIKDVAYAINLDKYADVGTQ